MGCALLLAAGLIPSAALAAPDDAVQDGAGDVAASEVELREGTYIEHEAIAYVRDSAAASSLTRSADVLSVAQELMSVSASSAEEALGDDASSADSSGQQARSLSASDDETASGTLVLVRNEEMTTEELIAAL